MLTLPRCQVMRAATLEAQDTKTSQGQRSNEAIVADIETVTSPLQIMDKVTPPYSLSPEKIMVHSFIDYLQASLYCK